LKKKLDQKMVCSIGTQSRVKLAKKSQTCPHYDNTCRKPQT